MGAMFSIHRNKPIETVSKNSVYKPPQATTIKTLNNYPVYQRLHE
jgi:hypothetical protein